MFQSQGCHSPVWLVGDLVDIGELANHLCDFFVENFVKHAIRAHNYCTMSPG